jgi:hypothetical protein
LHRVFSEMAHPILKISIESDSMYQRHIQYVFFEGGQNLKCPGESSIIWGGFSRIVYFWFSRKNRHTVYCSQLLEKLNITVTPNIISKYIFFKSQLNYFSTDVQYSRIRAILKFDPIGVIKKFDADKFQDIWLNIKDKYCLVLEKSGF